MSNVKLISNCRNWNCKISPVAVLRVHGGSELSGAGQKTILVHLLVLVRPSAGWCWCWLVTHSQFMGWPRPEVSRAGLCICISLDLWSLLTQARRGGWWTRGASPWSWPGPPPPPRSGSGRGRGRCRGSRGWRRGSPAPSTRCTGTRSLE